MMIISVSFQHIKQIIMIRGEEISVFESLGKVAATICKLQPLSLICCMTRTTPYPGDIQNYSATLFITNFDIQTIQYLPFPISYNEFPSFLHKYL